MSLLLTQTPIMPLFLLLSFLFGYFSGSVPYGLLLGKLFGAGDIRESGSGNIGATNALRVGGKKIAILTLLCDILKGAVPIIILKNIHMDYAVLAAIGAFLGHIFPVWLDFKGGKGVAVAVGISFAFSVYLGLVICFIWLVTAKISKYSSLSALVAFSFSPIITAFIVANTSVTIVMAFIAMMIWLKHSKNIEMLSKGTESKINLKK